MRCVQINNYGRVRAAHVVIVRLLCRAPDVRCRLTFSPVSMTLVGGEVRYFFRRQSKALIEDISSFTTDIDRACPSERAASALAPYCAPSAALLK